MPDVFQLLRWAVVAISAFGWWFVYLAVYLKQKKQLHFRCNCLVISAEWTGHEPMPYTPQFQYFNSLQIKNSRLTPV